MAATAAGLLVALAAGGVTSTSGSPLASYLLGPFSLLLIPAMFVAAQFPISQTASVPVVLVLSGLLYTTCLAWGLRRWRRAGAANSPREAGSG